MVIRAALSCVVGLLIVVGVAACVGPRPTPTPELTLPEPAVAPPAPLVVDAAASPPPVESGPRVRVVGAGGEGVNLRAQPGPSGARLKGLFDGAELELIGADSQVDGRTWRPVRDPSSRSEGWVASEFLEPVQ